MLKYRQRLFSKITNPLYDPNLDSSLFISVPQRIQCVTQTFIFFLFNCHHFIEPFSRYGGDFVLESTGDGGEVHVFWFLFWGLISEACVSPLFGVLLNYFGEE